MPCNTNIRATFGLKKSCVEGLINTPKRCCVIKNNENCRGQISKAILALLFSFKVFKFTRANLSKRFSYIRVVLFKNSFENTGSSLA